MTYLSELIEWNKIVKTLLEVSIDLSHKTYLIGYELGVNVPEHSWNYLIVDQSNNWHNIFHMY